MIFKDKKIKELEVQLENPNLSDEERVELEKQLATLKSEKPSLPWGWIIGISAVILVYSFLKIVGLFVNKKPVKAHKIYNEKITKPVHYTANDFITKTVKKKHPAGYSKLNSEISLLKNKLKNQKVGHLVNPSNTAQNITGSNKSIVIFVNPKYMSKIKLQEGYKSPVQIANTALKYTPAGYNSPYKNYANPNAANNILIPEGAIISAYTKYKLYSYNTSVPVIAVVSAPYSFKGKVVIPSGYEFMGSVSGHTKSRLDIKFKQIINPANGQSININAIAVMQNGSAGIVGNAHYHVIQNVLAGIGAGILGATAMFAGGGSAMNSNGAYTYQDTLRQNVAQNETQYAQNSLNNATQSASQVVITLPAKTPIKIMFLKPLTRK